MRIILIFSFIFYSTFLFGKDLIKIYIISNFPEDKDVLYSAQLSFYDFAKKNNPDFDLKFIPLNDSWSKNKIKSAIKTAEKNSKYIIFTSTSTAFMEIYNLIKNKNLLVFACGPTTTKISHINDNVIRNIPDTESEQKQIASYFNKMHIKKILILKENKFNPDYTNIAFKYFKKFFKNFYKVINFSALNLDINLKELKNDLAEFNDTYILAGGAVNEIALLTKLIRNLNFFEKIYLTPWIDIKLMKNIIKDKENIYYFSYISKNKKLEKFKKDFLSKYGHYPSFLTSYLTYEIVQILCSTFEKVEYFNLLKVKSYILNHKFHTIFGLRTFDKFGDSSIKLRLYELPK